MKLGKKTKTEKGTFMAYASCSCTCFCVCKCQNCNRSLGRRKTKSKNISIGLLTGNSYIHTWQYSFEANNDPNVAAKGR